MKKVSFYWFRRDLRLEDNAALYAALSSGNNEVVPLFIFDKNILDDLENPSDPRVTFIYQTLGDIRTRLRDQGGDLLVKYGEPVEVWKSLIKQYDISGLYYNRDYEPYAVKRDQMVAGLLEGQGIEVHSFKDQVIFEADEVTKKDGDPYVVFTPYKRSWLEKKASEEDSRKDLPTFPSTKHLGRLCKDEFAEPPSLESMGFKERAYIFPDKEIDKIVIRQYEKKRDFPAEDGTSRLGVHLRFGTISIRSLVNQVSGLNAVFLSELIWREFYSQILSYFPKVVEHSFRSKYDQIPWINDAEEFAKWCDGMTGYPMVDAGMRQLNQTGYMHNRVRMITASFLTKHLLIDWRWGEAYFAKKLLDYDLASNNGGWQWAAGCGTDAAPYFRIFNPITQQKKFDPQGEYVRKWIPELDDLTYPEPIVDHKWARERCLQTYKSALS